MMRSPTYGEIRPFDSAPSSEHDIREDGQRDSDRILYSSAFRRLSGVTQVVSPRDDYVLHDRAMHSLKVAQIGMTLAAEINHYYSDHLPMALDPWVVHAACLAHDLGHPPFGHAGERELQDILVPQSAGTPSDRTQPILRDSFEGNAQTFRVVSRLSARKKDEYVAGTTERTGLNLTWRTYAAIQKYPWTKGKAPETHSNLSNEKWGAYDSERGFLEEAIAFFSNTWGGSRSIEAEVMDWADDIAYGVHDTEDFFRAGLIPLHLLSANVENMWGRFVSDAHDRVSAAVRKTGLDFDSAVYERVARDLAASFPSGEYDGSWGSRERLHKFASDNIGALSRDLGVLNGSVTVPLESRTRVEILKKLTKTYVIDKAELSFDQSGRRSQIRFLFEELWHIAKGAWVDGNGGAKAALPSRFREYCEHAFSSYMDVYGTDEARLARATVDFICSLTDRQATMLARRLAGLGDSGDAAWHKM